MVQLCLFYYSCPRVMVFLLHVSLCSIVIHTTTLSDISIFYTQFTFPAPMRRIRRNKILQGTITQPKSIQLLVADVISDIFERTWEIVTQAQLPFNSGKITPVERFLDHPHIPYPLWAEPSKSRLQFIDLKHKTLQNSKLTFQKVQIDAFRASRTSSCQQPHSGPLESRMIYNTIHQPQDQSVIFNPLLDSQLREKANTILEQERKEMLMKRLGREKKKNESLQPLNLKDRKLRFNRAFNLSRQETKLNSMTLSKTPSSLLIFPSQQKRKFLFLLASNSQKKEHLRGKENKSNYRLILNQMNEDSRSSVKVIRHNRIHDAANQPSRYKCKKLPPVMV